MFIFFQVSIWSINSSQEIGSNENREKNTSHLKRVSLQMQSLHNIKWLLLLKSFVLSENKKMKGGLCCACLDKIKTSITV